MKVFTIATFVFQFLVLCFYLIHMFIGILFERSVYCLDYSVTFKVDMAHCLYNLDN